MATTDPRALARTLAENVAAVADSIEEGVNATLPRDADEQTRAVAAQIAASMVVGSLIVRYRLTPEQVSVFVQSFIGKELGEPIVDVREALLKAILAAGVN